MTNRDRQEEEDEISAQKINDKTTFVELPDQFEEDVVRDLFKDLEHKKEEQPYVEPQVQDAQTIESETATINNEFYDLKHQFDQVNNAATELKKRSNWPNWLCNWQWQSFLKKNRHWRRLILKMTYLTLRTQLI